MTKTEIIEEQNEKRTPEQIEADKKKAIISLRFDNQESHFQQIERDFVILRAFFVKYRETLAPLDWNCYGWNDRKIIFCTHGGDAKKIAKAFGSDGWVREHDKYSCGSINWLKTIDGCILKIEGAECIKPRLIEEVKL